MQSVQAETFDSLNGLGWLEFIPQPANPGVIPANTLWQDDGTNFNAGTLVWGDLSSPSLLGPNFSVGNPGLEQGGIDVNGANYDAVQKINSIGGALDASLILHRHSTSFPAILTYARANSETSAHAAVTLGQTLGSNIYVGWTGTHYDIGAVIDARVGPVGTVGTGSLPTEIAIFTTPDGADAAALAMIVGSDQTIYGDIIPGGTLRLQGSQDAALGTIDLVAPVNLDYDFTVSGINSGIRWNNVIPATGGAVVGMIRNTAQFTVNNALFISASVYDTSLTEHIVNPGFAVATLFLAQPVYQTTTAAVNPIQSFILAAQPQFVNDGAGAGRTVGAFYAVSAGGTLVARNSGDTLTVTNYTGLQVQGIWSTVAGSTVNFGTYIGVNVLSPVKGIFFPGAGIERMAAYYGLQVANPTLNNGFGTMPAAAVRSSILSGTNKHFLLNAGTAHSAHGSAHMYFDDNFGTVYGGTSGIADFDAWWAWNTSRGVLAMTFASTFDALDFTSPAANRFLISSNDNSANEVEFDFKKFAFGQAGAVGNQVGIFVANARTAGVAGGWADFLLTQAGNLNLGVFGMGDVSAWVINPISFDNTAASIAELATLRTQMNSSAPGLTVTRRASIWNTGRIYQRGKMAHDAIDRSLGATTNDWAPATLNSARQVVRVTATIANVNITGLALEAGQTEDTLWVVNVSAVNTITLQHQNVGSAAANRFISPSGADYLLGPDEACMIWYDATTGRQRILWGTGA